MFLLPLQEGKRLSSHLFSSPFNYFAADATSIAALAMLHSKEKSLKS